MLGRSRFGRTTEGSSRRPLTVTSPQGNGSIKGYLVRPANAEKLPVVLVVHENRGLNPYIEDVARRLAVRQFRRICARWADVGGWLSGDDEKGAALFKTIDGAKMREDFLAAATWLKSARTAPASSASSASASAASRHQSAGGAMSSDLDAAVPFYGSQPSADDVAKIKAPLLAHYGELDTRITSGWPAFRCRAHGRTRAHMKVMCMVAPITASTTIRPPVMTKLRPALAWQRTLNWFNKYLTSTG